MCRSFSRYVESFDVFQTLFAKFYFFFSSFFFRFFSNCMLGTKVAFFSFFSRFYFQYSYSYYVKLAFNHMPLVEGSKMYECPVSKTYECPVLFNSILLCHKRFTVSNVLDGVIQIFIGCILISVHVYIRTQCVLHTHIPSGNESKNELKAMVQWDSYTLGYTKPTSFNNPVKITTLEL